MSINSPATNLIRDDRGAHMCRDGHHQIWHNDSSDDERCPLCRERDRSVYLEEALRDVLDTMHPEKHFGQNAEILLRQRLQSALRLAAGGAELKARDPYSWQPIATVPLNAEVLLWSVGSKYDQPGLRIGRYEVLFGRPVPIIGPTIYSTTAEQFTHWAPAPGSPASSAISGEQA